MSKWIVILAVIWMKNIILLFLIVSSAQSFAESKETNFDYFVSSGFPYIFRTNLETTYLSKYVDVNFDYRISAVSTAFRGAAVFNKEGLRNNLTYSLGFETGDYDPLTHEIGNPYSWDGMFVEIRKQKYFN